MLGMENISLDLGSFYFLKYTNIPFEYHCGTRKMGYFGKKNQGLCLLAALAQCSPIWLNISNLEKQKENEIKKCTSCILERHLRCFIFYQAKLQDLP